MQTSIQVKRNLQIAIAIAVTIRFVMILCFQHNFYYMNADEERNYSIATNYLAGHGYSVWDATTHTYVQTSFHATFLAYLYIGLQLLHIPKIAWIIFVQFLSIVMYGLSAFYFFKLAQLLLKKQYAFWATILYLFFPSFTVYVGPFFLYEHIVVAFIIIIIWQASQLTQGLGKPAYWLSIPFMSAICMLIRPNALLIFGLILISLLFIGIKKKQYKAAGIALVAVLLCILVQLPILIKNHNQFGVYTLSTQSGFELLQGHNPTARGSWRGDWEMPGNPLYDYAHSTIPGLDTMNEMQSSNARKKQAITWIKQNPKQEIILLGRKLAIFFLPKNYEVMPTSQILNPINGLVYLLAIVAFALQIVKKQYNIIWYFATIPIAMCIFMSLVFFVSYRLRYYAEPFMCLFAVWAIQYFAEKRAVNKYETATLKN